MHALAAEYSRALGRPVAYLDLPLGQSRDRNCAPATCQTISTSIFWRWPTCMPPTVMIVSRTMSSPSRTGPRQASTTMSRSTASCSSRMAGPRRFWPQAQPIFVACRAGDGRQIEVGRLT